MYLFALTHLTCTRRDCCVANEGFCVHFEDGEEDEKVFNAQLTAVVLDRMSYSLFVAQLHSCSDLDFGLPAELPSDSLSNLDFQTLMFDVLFNKAIVTGALVCRRCGCEYPIEGGIPCMRLPEADKEA